MPMRPSIGLQINYQEVHKKAPVETGAGLAYEKTCCKQPVCAGLLLICNANINQLLKEK
jgi:hypothetical protein